VPQRIVAPGDLASGIQIVGVQMSRERKFDLMGSTPIERIFEKVMGRKMTAHEKTLFHVRRLTKSITQKASTRTGSAASSAAKLTGN